MKGLGLDLLSFKFCICVVEIEQDCTLMQLFDEELRALIWREFCVGRKIGRNGLDMRKRFGSEIRKN